jgi:uncharacterized protein (DUF488 family)
MKKWKPQEIIVNEKVKLFTIGFTKKSAETFFGKLEKAGVKKIIDIRLNNISQLAGFSKKNDLIYFLKTICGCGYRHETLLAPTEQILEAYKKKMISWTEYANKFNDLLRVRKAHELVSASELHGSCLLCSEPVPDKCHRRLVAEYFRDHFNNISITHL